MIIGQWPIGTAILPGDVGKLFGAGRRQFRAGDFFPCLRRPDEGAVDLRRGIGVLQRRDPDLERCGRSELSGYAAHILKEARLADPQLPLSIQHLRPAKFDTGLHLLKVRGGNFAHPEARFAVVILPFQQA